MELENLYKQEQILRKRYYNTIEGKSELNVLLSNDRDNFNELAITYVTTLCNELVTIYIYISTLYRYERKNKSFLSLASSK